jgi:hypothetical protein
MNSTEPKPVALFNSRFETGVRAVFVLHAIYPRALDLERLVALDHFVVHTADLGGPSSLHPATATRASEMLVRRELVHDGLMLMQGCYLAERCANQTGLTYRAGPEAATFTSLLKGEYFEGLRTAAHFLASFFDELGDDEFDAIVKRQLEEWAIQFQVKAEPGIP